MDKNTIQRIGDRLSALVFEIDTLNTWRILLSAEDYCSYNKRFDLIVREVDNLAYGIAIMLSEMEAKYEESKS